jgi:RiboL-PSP-HEPN
MKRPELQTCFERIDALANEMQSRVPVSKTGVEDFRADLAGLLTVIIAATYETCVKETLLGFSLKHNQAFFEYVERRYEKLNSRITVGDLGTYCAHFSPTAKDLFKANRKKRKDRIYKSLGQDIEEKYQQILNWRHSFAHTGTRNTTIEEVIEFHRYARHVLFAFYDSFQ